MTMPFYILDDDDNPVETDQETWTLWHRKEKEKGDKNRCSLGSAVVHGMWISTEFVGWGHRLWETRVSTTLSPLAQDVFRYSSRADAVAGHERECNWYIDLRAELRQEFPDLNLDDMDDAGDKLVKPPEPAPPPIHPGLVKEVE